jgi:hypothetical protein
VLAVLPGFAVVTEAEGPVAAVVLPGEVLAATPAPPAVAGSAVEPGVCKDTVFLPLPPEQAATVLTPIRRATTANFRPITRPVSI